MAGFDLIKTFHAPGRPAETRKRTHVPVLVLGAKSCSFFLGSCVRLAEQHHRNESDAILRSFKCLKEMDLIVSTSVPSLGRPWMFDG